MLLAFPIRTDAPVRRLPYVNYTLIALNIAIFTVFAALRTVPAVVAFKNALVLDAARPQLFEFLTYQFLHADYWHLGGNMLFLWIFGNAVNSKMGHLPYALFYLGGGIFSGAGYAFLNDHALLGASGAIAAVTTAYLVLFPHSEVSLFYWIWFYIGTLHIQALLIIGVKIILYDNIIAPELTGGGNVAHGAHLAGYLFGFCLSLLLLAIRALPRDQYDILALWKRAYQRAQLRQAMADPDARAQAMYGRVARPVAVAMGRPVQAVAPEVVDEIAAVRNRIAEQIDAGDYTAAADAWQNLVVRHPDQCLPKKHMLDVANQLATLGRHAQAAAAYEKYLKHYPKTPDVEQVALLLGILYARHLNQYEPAAKHLQNALARLTNPQQREAATQWLDAVTAALRPAGTSGPSPA